MKTRSHLTWNRPQLLSRNSSHATADGQSSETHMNFQAVYRLSICEAAVAIIIFENAEYVF